jgi:Response regulators consisting of a CheY-like receiver domain and a winged-helix DNA-binding domain
MKDSYRILLVEDESSIRGFLKINLKRENFTVFEAPSGEEGIKIARLQYIDIVILDIMLPGIDGFKVCEILRQEFPMIGIIMLTAKGQDIDRIMGLEYGADDYMIKPFNPIELVLRVKSLLRRMDRLPEMQPEIIERGPFRVDTYSQKLFKNEMEIELTPTEYSLIKIFVESPGKAFKRDDLLNLIWGYDFFGDSKIVDVNIRRLRAKVEDNPGQPRYIETIWGTGYRWRRDDAEDI